jgi:mannose-1-phosphate guanylyltransferase
MLPIAGKPLLERTITYLSSYGVTEFIVCVAYLKKQIIDAFGDGTELGVKIEYAEADSPLGTAGQLKTAERFIDGTFI